MSPTASASDGLTDVGAAGHGRLLAGAGGLQAHFRRPGRAGALRLHVLDSTDPTCDRRRAGRDRPRAHAVHRLLEVRRHDRAAVAVRPLLRAAGATARNFVAITDPGSGLAELATRERLPAHLLRRPRHRRALQRAVAVRDRAGDADGRRHRRAAAAASRRLAGRRPRTRGAQGMPGAVWLGAALAALARAGRDKLTFAIAPSLPGLGLWLEQLVAESTGKHGHGHPARRRGAARRPGRLRRGPRVRAPARPGGARRRERGSGSRRSPPPGTRSSRSRPPGPETSAASSCSPRSRSPSPAGASRSTPSISPTCSRPRTRPTACWRASSRAASCQMCPSAGETRSCASCCSASGAAGVRGADGLRASRARTSTPPPPSCARRSAPRRSATTTFGYGPRFLHSTGQFHKGGPKTGRFLQLLHDGPRRRPDPRPPVHVPDAQGSAGDRRHRDAARARPARRAGAARRRGSSRARCAL